MKNVSKTLFILVLTGQMSFAQKLFNGKDLTGWHIDCPALDNNKEMRMPFEVRNGTLVSLGLPEGHLISDREYSHYQLSYQYRFPGQPGNCGLLVHVSKPRRLYKMFPQSVEVQMMHQNAGDFWVIGEDIETENMEARRGPKEKWGIEEDMGRRIINLTDGTEKPLGQWNTMKVLVNGPEIKVWLNGVLVNHGTKCTATKGKIALQAEGAEVEFKNFKFSKLD